MKLRTMICQANLTTDKRSNVANGTNVQINNLSFFKFKIWFSSSFLYWIYQKIARLVFQQVCHQHPCFQMFVFSPILMGWFVCLNATLYNSSVISWRSALLVEETGKPGENHQPVASRCQTWSHNVVHLTMIEIRTHNISGDRHWSIRSRPRRTLGFNGFSFSLLILYYFNPFQDMKGPGQNISNNVVYRIMTVALLCVLHSRRMLRNPEFR